MNHQHSKYSEKLTNVKEGKKIGMGDSIWTYTKLQIMDVRTIEIPLYIAHTTEQQFKLKPCLYIQNQLGLCRNLYFDVNTLAVLCRLLNITMSLKSGKNIGTQKSTGRAENAHQGRRCRSQKIKPFCQIY